MTRAKLEGARLVGATLTRARLDMAQLNRAILISADVSSASLVGANLTETNLWGARFTQAQLNYARLDGAALNQTRFDSAYLKDATISNTVLHIPDEATDIQTVGIDPSFWSDADLYGTNFSGTDLIGGVGLTIDQLAFAVGDEKTQLDLGFFIMSCIRRPAPNEGIWATNHLCAEHEVPRRFEGRRPEWN